MPIYTCKLGQTVAIDKDISLTVLGICDEGVKLGISGPPDTVIRREGLPEWLIETETEGAKPLVN
jgi:carbon storage regulator CsrA